MKRRINITYKLVWNNITTNGELVPLTGRDIKVELINPLGRREFVSITITDQFGLSFLWTEDQQKILGDYSLTVWENYGKSNQTALDRRKVVTLVATTEEEDIANNDNLTADPEIRLEGGNISSVVNGESAYEIAVRNGFVGTEEEYLASLKGDPGEKGADGGIYYPRFHVDKNMHLIVESEGPSEARFEIENGHLMIKI